MIVQGNSMHIPLSDHSVQCVVTSPPYYGLRSYGIGTENGEIGLEPSTDEYVSKMVQVFREVWRVLKDNGVVFLNLGDSYAGSGCGTNDYRTEASRSIDKSDKMYSKTPPQQKRLVGLKPKDLIGIPWRVAFALQADGWYLRSEIIWAKLNPMTESVKDRPTKSHEQIFLLTKSSKYYYDAEAIKTPTKGSEHDKHARTSRKRFPTAEINGIRGEGYYPMANKRDVWTINTQPFRGAHFAVMPEKLVDPCILAGSKQGDIVLDPFAGSGTVGVVAYKHGREFVGVELNMEYIKIAEKRIQDIQRQIRIEFPDER